MWYSTLYMDSLAGFTFGLQNCSSCWLCEWTLLAARHPAHVTNTVQYNCQQTATTGLSATIIIHKQVHNIVRTIPVSNHSQCAILVTVHSHCAILVSIHSQYAVLVTVQSWCAILASDHWHCAYGRTKHSLYWYTCGHYTRIIMVYTIQ